MHFYKCQLMLWALYLILHFHSFEKCVGYPASKDLGVLEPILAFTYARSELSNKPEVKFFEKKGE